MLAGLPHSRMFRSVFAEWSRRWLRAGRQAHANFAGSLSDDVRHRAIDATTPSVNDTPAAIISSTILNAICSAARSRVPANGLVSFVAERDDRIDAAGAMCRDQSGQRRNDRQQQHRPDHDGRVLALDPVQAELTQTFRVPVETDHRQAQRSRSRHADAEPAGRKPRHANRDAIEPGPVDRGAEAADPVAGTST
jgi:hypothetical protein